MSRHPKDKKNKKNGNKQQQTQQHEEQKKQNNILDRIGNKTRELANKLIPIQWKSQSVLPKLQNMHQHQTKHQPPTKHKYRKQKIPIALRQACWVRQFGETYQHKCFVDWCHRKLTCFDFEVGHNLPESKGGTLDLDNLRPICRQCNTGMGNMYTIDEWRLLKIKS